MNLETEPVIAELIVKIEFLEQELDKLTEVVNEISTHLQIYNRFHPSKEENNWVNKIAKRNS